MSKALTKKQISEVLDALKKHGTKRAAAAALGLPTTTYKDRLTIAVRLEKERSVPIPKTAYRPDNLSKENIGKHGLSRTCVQLPPKGKVNRFVLTSAQNNTDINMPFFKNLKALCSSIDAKLMVSYTIYDKNSYKGPVKKGERSHTGNVWFDKRIKEFAVNEGTYLAPDLAFCADMDILASASSPLSALDSFEGNSSCIFPHNKFSMRCVDSLHGSPVKRLYTTGSLTERNFIQRKTGQKASFHHVLGALLVEVDDTGTWWAHHINSDRKTGNFQVLDIKVSRGRVRTGYGIEGLVCGDIHHEKLDPVVEKATWGKGGIVEELSPRVQMLHDVTDFYRRNHHNVKSPYHRVITDVHEKGTVREDIDRACEFVLKIAAMVRNTVWVRANHDQAFEKWIETTDWKSDPMNASFYLESALEYIRKAEKGVKMQDANLMEWRFRHVAGLPAKKTGGETVTFLGCSDSYTVKEIECGMHGHIGPSGSRGSPKGYSRLGFKAFTAHTHSPSIVDGVYTAGVSATRDMGYNVGPNKICQTHGIIYPNGKRGFLDIKNGKWRA